jgi:hypothetical protein
MVRKLLTNVWFQRIFGCLITAFALSVLIISAVSFVAEIWFDINIGFMLFATIFLLLLMLFLASIGLYAVNTKMWDAVHKHKSNNICFMLLPDLKGIVEMLQWVGDLTNGDA